MIEFKLPDLGENIERADISQLLVAEGDMIQAEQPILELETAKAVFELPCPHAGRVAKLYVKKGDTVAVGASLLTLDESVVAELVPAVTKPAEGKRSAADKAKHPVEPEVGLARSATAEPARVALAKASPIAPPRTTDKAPAHLPSAAAERPPAPAGPATRRLARELGIDLHEVSGTGAGGRITAEDVKAYARRALSEAPSAAALEAPPLPDFSQWGPVERRPLNKIARVSAEHLSLAWRLAPHVTQHELADVTEVEAGRKQYAQAHGADAPKITMTVLALRAVVAALKAYPQFNSSYDSATGELILKKYHHIGVAVDTEQGLLVPVLRNVDRKSTVELAAELADFAARARARKLQLHELQGGTFTVTNLGGIGGTAFTPIINYPEVAILGMSRASWQQVIVDGQAATRLLLPLSLSYDHRVINGADGVRFLRKVATLLSDPVQLVIES